MLRVLTKVLTSPVSSVDMHPANSWVPNRQSLTNPAWLKLRKTLHVVYMKPMAVRINRFGWGSCEAGMFTTGRCSSMNDFGSLKDCCQADTLMHRTVAPAQHARTFWIPRQQILIVQNVNVYTLYSYIKLNTVFLKWRNMLDSFKTFHFSIYTHFVMSGILKESSKWQVTFQDFANT